MARSDRGEVRRVVTVQTGVLSHFRLGEPVRHILAEVGESEQPLVKHRDDLARLGVAGVDGEKAMEATAALPNGESVTPVAG